MLASSKDWVIDDQIHAEQQEKQLDQQIGLNEVINKEIEALNPRRSRRIAQKKEEKDTINAYTFYLSSLPMNPKKK